MPDQPRPGLEPTDYRPAIRLLQRRTHLDQPNPLTAALHHTLGPPSDDETDHTPLATGWDLTPGDASTLFGLPPPAARVRPNPEVPANARIETGS